MKVVVAPQAFKGTASAAVVAAAMSRGVLQAMPHSQVVSIPIADGGSGTVDALVTATGGRYVTSPAGDPLGRPIAARWGALGDGETAVIEVSAASGLSLLSVAERDPTITTTRGTGDLIRAALDAGYTRILIGLGDSATNDAGVGMAQALGVRALDDMGRDLPNGGAALMRLHSLELEDVHPRLASARITALCDVTNPLCGPGGASAVFGPQKGATASAGIAAGRRPGPFLRGGRSPNGAQCAGRPRSGSRRRAGSGTCGILRRCAMPRLPGREQGGASGRGAWWSRPRPDRRGADRCPDRRRQGCLRRRRPLKGVRRPAGRRDSRPERTG